LGDRVSVVFRHPQLSCVPANNERGAVRRPRPLLPLPHHTDYSDPDIGFQSEDQHDGAYYLREPDPCAVRTGRDRLLLRPDWFRVYPGGPRYAADLRKAAETENEMTPEA